ncbi:MAG: ribosome small subunit-dependent GTPase A [Phycisphaerae bacterium]|nr:ribosome small subunit-dependent GTPase A [Phycisphaerae bacterium]
MARKGKSRRRIKDWHARWQAGQELDEVDAHGRRMSERGVKLRQDRFAASDDLDGLPRADGMVTGLFRGGATVRPLAPHGGDDAEWLCGIAKTFRPPSDATPLAVGDIVTVALLAAGHADAADADRDRADGMILTREERTTALARPRPWSAKRRDRYGTEPRAKVIAANMDVLLIVAAVKRPTFRRALIDRFLIVAEHGGLKPVLVVNKTDLKPPDETLLGEFRALGVAVLPTSARTGDGVGALAGVLAGHKNVLAGASGVGKTALVNHLVPGTTARTRSVRSKDDRGRHTTSSAAVYDLPDGGILVDTPGVRELGVNLDAADLPWYFPEIERVASSCKFNNCTHTHEPDCAVRAAVEAGGIPARRYDSYLRILESIEG